jgi:2-polyprenyl-6-methoxyphenol hydroxylase-like FAD-dependent oxidoreductase
MKETDFDVIVVGARVAGCILAGLLAWQGHRVLLLDRAHFPSDTLSTHFFRAPALQSFERLGILAEVLASGPPLRQSFNDIDGRVFSELVNGPDGLSFYLCIRRITLDWLLAQRVQQETKVELHQGARVQELLWQDNPGPGKAGVVVRWTEGGQNGAASAQVVIGADGFYSQVAKLVEPAYEHFLPVQRAMYYTYYANLEPQPAEPGPAAEHHYRGNHLVYVFPTDGKLTLIAASLPINEFERFRQDPQASLQAELAVLPTLSPRLRRAEQVSPVKGAANIPCYQRIPYGPGWALVGDAGMVMDPWSGQGIDQASTHACLLADALHAWLAGEMGWAEAMAGYHQSRNAFSEKAYQRTSTYARDLRPMTQAALQRRGLL